MSSSDGEIEERIQELERRVESLDGQVTKLMEQLNETERWMLKVVEVIQNSHSH